MLSDSNCFTDNKRHVWWLAFWTALALNAPARRGAGEEAGKGVAAANSSSLALTICRFWFALVIWIWMGQDLRLSVAARERGRERLNVKWVWCECVSECQCEHECECVCVCVHVNVNESVCDSAGRLTLLLSYQMLSEIYADIAKHMPVQASHAPPPTAHHSPLAVRVVHVWLLLGVRT